MKANICGRMRHASRKSSILRCLFILTCRATIRVMTEPNKDLIIWEDRPLTQEEVDLLRWLIENRQTGSEDFLSQLSHLRVVSRCGCGCASVDFSYDGIAPDRTTGLEPFSDWFWGTEGVDLACVFAFDRNGKVGGIEVYSVDGSRTPTELPNIDDLREFTDPDSRKPGRRGLN